jgi:hypothetical protein
MIFFIHNMIRVAFITSCYSRRTFAVRADSFLAASALGLVVLGLTRDEFASAEFLVHWHDHLLMLHAPGTHAPFLVILGGRRHQPVLATFVPVGLVAHGGNGGGK